VRLGLKLFLGFFLIAGIAAFFVMRVFVNEVKPGVRQAIESTLVDAANLLAEVAAPDLAAGRIDSGAFAQQLSRAQLRDPHAWVWRFAKRSIDCRVVVTDAAGIVVFDSSGRELGRDNSRWNDVYRTLRGEYGARSSPEDQSQPEVASVMHVAAPIFDPIDRQRLIGVLTLSQPNRSIEPFIRASQRNILERGAWLVVIAALIGILATWWLSRGIGGLQRYARAVSNDEPVPPPPPRRDEIGALGQALEQMRQKLAGKAYVEQYVQSLTHEMKSPLAAIRAAAELLQEPLPEADRQHFVGNIQAQERRLTETIDKLLALAEVEQHGWLRRPLALDLAAVINAALQACTLQAEGRGVALRLQQPAPLPTVQGDAFLLRQALCNLLDNAIAFAPAGSAVVLAVSVLNEHVQLCVDDAGPGLPEYAHERVFERFYSLPRPDGAPRSSGLGLPFVREVARLHGGSVRLENRPEGGARALLSLPLLRQPSAAG
jgi:two-component system sensor histidine kinase CreC